LKGKTVLITGANGGIGRSLVEAFAREGYAIIAHLRKEKIDFLEYAATIEERYATSVTPIYFDLENEEEVKVGIKKIINNKTKVDVLVNNAGIAYIGLLQMTSLSEIRRIFDVNFFSIVQITQLISRLMTKNGGGTIINIASVAGLILEEGNMAYAVSKAAVMAFTKTIAKELASQNIRVNAIAPGLTDTGMAKLTKEKAGNTLLHKTAFNRLAQPSEIANVALFLSSDKASFITGQVIRVDGGM
jgi:3-oxoacyl-[acyl-carrier protein] reductase